jgi:cytidylate kinase
MVGDMVERDLGYRAIAISGGPGTGKETLKQKLLHTLSPLGWTAFSGGDHMRAYAIEKGYVKEDEQGKAHHNASVYPPDFDREVDFASRDRLRDQKNIILEAWLAGLFAQRLDHVLKVVLHVPEVSITVA